MREKRATLDGINLHEGVLGLDDDDVLTNQNASWGVHVHRLLSGGGGVTGGGRERGGNDEIIICTGVVFGLSVRCFRAKNNHH